MNICLDNHRQQTLLAILATLEKLIERLPRTRRLPGLPALSVTIFGDFAGACFRFHDDEFIARFGRGRQAKDLDRQGRDGDAAMVLREGLAIDPAAPTMRSKLYYIQASRGDWPAARLTASAGLAQGDTMFASLVVRADSALGASAITPTPAAQ